MALASNMHARPTLAECGSTARGCGCEESRRGDANNSSDALGRVRVVNNAVRPADPDSTVGLFIADNEVQADAQVSGNTGTVEKSVQGKRGRRHALLHRERVTVRRRLQHRWGVRRTVHGFWLAIGRRLSKSVGNHLRMHRTDIGPYSQPTERPPASTPPPCGGTRPVMSYASPSFS
jgi:hypothetical protein